MNSRSMNSRPGHSLQPAASRRIRVALAVAAVLASVPDVCLGADPFELKVESNVAVKMRDGVTLRADVFRPRAEGKFPVILERTPYDKRSGLGFGLKAAAQGYVYIAQDVRGRWASEGDWCPFKYEMQDGYDSVEWAAALPYSNGKVGMFGGSYVGATQMLAAIAAPPHLAGLMPVVTASNYHEHWAYQGGAFCQLLAQAWSSALALNVHERKISGSALPSHFDFMLSPSKYPVLDIGNASGLADYYFDWIAHPTYDDYWKQWSIEEHFDKIQVPALHVAAWYDLFQDGSIRNYAGIKSKGGTEAARRGQRLVIIPGGHAGKGPKIGEVDFGESSVLDTWALGLRWYDYLLKGIDNGIAAEKPVRVFFTGRNAWQEEDTWPPARTRATRYYLHSGGKGNSLSGDGSLGLAPPASEPPDRYEYDPANPTPTLGGPTLGDPHFPAGPFDQRKIEERKDVLVYTTPAFDNPLTLAGPVSLELYVSSSAVDTDFTGRLIDVAPDGVALNLSDGVLRARYRNSMEKPELMQPGQVYKMTLNLWSTAHVVLPGHRLRLEVASASFPRFSRNLNTAEQPERGTDHVTANNTVFHDETHRSAIILPVTE